MNNPGKQEFFPGYNYNMFDPVYAHKASTVLDHLLCENLIH